MKKIIIKGNLTLKDYGDDYDAIYVGGEALLPYLRGEVFDNYWKEETICQVSVRYLISDNPIDCFETEITNYIMQLEGEMYLEYRSCYTEITGYLWTDKNFIIGGHDLLSELYPKCNKGNYIYLEMVKEERSYEI